MKHYSLIPVLRCWFTIFYISFWEEINKPLGINIIHPALQKLLIYFLFHAFVNVNKSRFLNRSAWNASLSQYSNVRSSDFRFWKSPVVTEIGETINYIPMLAIHTFLTGEVNLLSGWTSSFSFNKIIDQSSLKSSLASHKQSSYRQSGKNVYIFVLLRREWSDSKNRWARLRAPAQNIP